MVGDAILTIVSGLLGWVLDIRPVWTVNLPAGVHDFVATMMSYDDLVPMTEVFGVIALGVGLVIALQTLKWSKWIVEVVRG
jgi:hypothetical protein